MMCQRIGRGPISTIGLGRYSVSSRSRVPWPPQRITTGMSSLSIMKSPWKFYRGSDVAESLELLQLPLVLPALPPPAGEPLGRPQHLVGRDRTHGMAAHELRIERVEQHLARRILRHGQPQQVEHRRVEVEDVR